jgi:hypothetical protein
MEESTQVGSFESGRPWGPSRAMRYWTGAHEVQGVKRRGTAVRGSGRRSTQNGERCAIRVVAS